MFLPQLPTGGLILFQRTYYRMEVVWRALSYKSSAAEARAARSNYKRFAERQLKENLKPILTIF